jgi:3'(2'), 5'-bisphosphate nucleotidase
MTLEKELEIAKNVILDAGEIILESRAEDLDVQHKSDGSPVTIADKKSAAYLTEVLSKSFPYGMLNEENMNNDTRSKHEYSWIVDPLDGTISYINGDDGFGIMIGLVRDGSPVLGVTYRPLKNELCYGILGEGSYISHDCGDTRLMVNKSEEISLLVSGHRQNDEVDQVINKLNPAKLRHMYTGFKTTEVAKGNANLFVCPESVEMCLWDVCGTSLILEEAGGRATDVKGNLIDYKGSAELKSGFVASNRIIHDYVIDRIGGN